MQTRTIPIKGMHCKSCEVLISEELGDLDGVEHAKVSVATGNATITAARMPTDAVIRQAVKAAGYEVGVDTKPLVTDNKRIWRDSLIGLLVVGALVLLVQLTGISEMATIADSGGGSGTLALIVGLTAGFSTCMALIGGLVLGVASRYAEDHPKATTLQKFRPHIFFNIGRIVSFTVLGAAIGMLGSAFQLKGSVLGFLTLLVGAVMLVIGLQLTEMFPRLRNVFTLPGGLAKKLGLQTRANREYSHKNAFVMGALTFFLPCGFTQAMQLLAVSTGSPTQAALIMGMFALGTTPGLLGVGGLTSVVKGAFAQRFFRIVGVVVVAMAIVNISSGLNLVGANRWIEQVKSWTPGAKQSQVAVPEGSLVLKTSYTLREDIDKTSFTTKVGQPTVLEVDVKENGQGCMSTILIPGLDDTPQYLKAGKIIRLVFTPTSPGTYQITCAMGVSRGTITVEA